MNRADRLPWKGGALRQFLRDSGHLIRPAVVLIAGLCVFLLIRTALIPKAFGKYGHYSPGALDVIRQRPVAYAGQDVCVMCHDGEAKERAIGTARARRLRSLPRPPGGHATPTTLRPTSPNCPMSPTSAGAAMKKTPPNPRTFPK